MNSISLDQQNKLISIITQRSRSVYDGTKQSDFEFVPRLKYC